MENDRDEKSRRLSVLLLDYEMGRDDERNHLAVQASLLAVALTVLGLFAGLLTQSCYLSKDPCLDVPDPVLSLAPFAPLAIIVYIQLVGSVATLRSFYMRGLERDIREMLRPNANISSYSGLRLPSYTELMIAHGTAARGARGPRQLIGFIFLGVLVVFGGLTVLVITWMPTYLKIFMIGAYGAGTLAIGMEARRATLYGRLFFKDTVDRMQRRLGESLLPLPQSQVGNGRKLLSYLVIPRPDDLIKALFFPASAVMTMVALDVDDVDILRAFWIWVVLDFLIYQARYQWNDIRGLRQDEFHPTSRLRGRLPIAEGGVRAAVTASFLGIALRLWLACVIGLSPAVDMGWWLGILAGSVFLVGGIYEYLRSILTPRTRAIARLSWAIFLLVGAGYAIRGVAGAAAVGLTWSGHAVYFVLLALFLWLLGSTFVVLTWALEAASYCVSSLDAAGNLGLRPLATVRYRPHLRHLLRFLPVWPNLLSYKQTNAALEELEVAAQTASVTKHDISQKLYLSWAGKIRLAKDERRSLRQQLALLRRDGGSTKGALERMLDSRGKFFAPWNIVTVFAALTGGLLGACLVGAETPLSLLSGLIGVLGGIALCVASNNSWRLGVLVLFLVVASLSAYKWLEVSAVDTILLVVPWAILGSIVVVFRAQDYRGLKIDWSAFSFGRLGITLAMLFMGREVMRRMHNSSS